MTNRYFNWKLAIVLLISIAVLGLTAIGLRRWQRNRNAQFALDAGIKAYNQQQWEQAAQNLGRFLATNPDNVPILLKYADAQKKIRPLKSDNVHQAISAYRAALRIEQSNCEAATCLAEIYLDVWEAPGEAEFIAKKQLGDDPNLHKNKDPELRRLLALALATQGKFNEASAELKTILQEYPGQVSAYETLGQLTDQESAEYWFNQAIKNNPTSALAHISRAGFYLLREDRTKALSDLEQAEQLDLSDPNVQLRLAKEFINANILEKGEKHLAAVQKTMPASEKLWQTWAQLAIKTRSQERMANVAEEGLKELSSQPWDFMPLAAELFIRAGRLDQANDCISKLQQKDIYPQVVTFLEGLVAEQKEQYYKAIKCWQRSIELGNKFPQIRLLSLESLASTYSRLGDTQSALRQLHTIVSENPNLLDGHLALARLSAQTGNWPETAEYTQRAMQLSPGNPEAILLHLQARMQLLTTGTPEENAQSQQDIKKQLSALEEATKGALEVKLVQLQLAIQQRNFADAEALVTQLKKDHPSQIRVAMAEADLLIAQEKTDEAISNLNEIVKQFPSAAEPVRLLALLLNQQKNREKCEATIKDALERIQQPAIHRELGLLLAELYTQWGQSEKVYPLLNELAQKLPNDISIKRRLLGCQQVIKDPEKAQRLVDDIKSLEGEGGWQWRYEQARAWFAADDFKNLYPQIITLLQENLLNNQDDQASRMLLAAAYVRAGELRLAISTYREALSRAPNDIRIIIPTVAALYKAKEYAQADEILNRSNTEGLHHPQLQRLQLQSHLRRGEFSPASDILQDIVKDDPNDNAARLSLALLEMQQNNFAEAEQLLSTLKAQSPGSLSVAYAQIQLNIRRSKPEEAIRVSNEIVNELGNASAYILRARTYTMLNQADKALSDLEHASTVEPNNVEVWLAKSEFHQTTGQIDSALAAIQRALSLAPNTLSIQKRAVSLFFAYNNPDKFQQGKTLLEEALKSNPDDIELRLFKARSLLIEGTAVAIADAQRRLEKITEDQPENFQAWAILGEIALLQEQYGKAVDASLRGLAYKPTDKILLTIKARAEAATLPILAIQTMKTLRDLDPNDINTIMQLANTYIAANQTENAVKLLENQLNVTTDAKVQRKLSIAYAVALYHNDNKSAAQEKFSSLLQSEPDDPSPLLAFARLFIQDKLWSRLNQSIIEWSGNHPQDTNTLIKIAQGLATSNDNQAQKMAEELLGKILNLEPNNLPAMSTLAMLLQMDGRNDESAKVYQKILERAPDNVIALNNLAWIMCEEQGKLQESLELTQKGLKIAPQYVDLIDTRGVIYYRLGEHDKAVQDFTTCLKLYPKTASSSVSSRFHLARAFAKLGQRQEALQHLNQALDMDSKTKSLSATDLTEAKLLLEKLQKQGG